MRKKIIAIMALLIFTLPIFAASIMGETVVSSIASGATAGALSGAGLGLVTGGPLTALIGAVFGLTAGAVGGFVTGTIKQKAEDSVKATEIETKIEDITQTNTQIEADLEANRIALESWQAEYDNTIAIEKSKAEEGLQTLKENWGIYNAGLGSTHREGTTAKLLSQTQKNKIIDYAGEDMSLDIDEATGEVKNVFEDESNYDEKGNMTDAGAQKLNNKKSNYGIYENQIRLLATQLFNNKNVLNKQKDINTTSLQINNNNIEKLKKEKSKLFTVWTN